MDALPGLILPHHGRWRVADTRPLALDASEDISCLHTCSWIFTRSMQLFTGEPRPSVGGDVADVCIPLIESLSWSVMRWVSAPGYMLSSMLNPGDAWLCFARERRYPRRMAGCPNPTQVGLAMPPSWFNRRAMRSIR
jgi:hypothetical protein